VQKGFRSQKKKTAPKQTEKDGKKNRSKRKAERGREGFGRRTARSQSEGDGMASCKINILGKEEGSQKTRDEKKRT